MPGRDSNSTDVAMLMLTLTITDPGVLRLIGVGDSMVLGAVVESTEGTDATVGAPLTGTAICP